MNFQPPPNQPPPKLNREDDIPGTTRDLMGVYIPGDPDVYAGHLQTVIHKKEPHLLNRPVPPTLTVWLLAVAVTAVSFLFPTLFTAIGQSLPSSPAELINFGTTPNELAGAGVSTATSPEEAAEQFKEQTRTAAWLLFGTIAAYLVTLGAAITAMVRGNNLIAFLGFAAFLLGPIAIWVLPPLYM